MTSPDGRYTIVLNGEVFNFPDLRAELESEGDTFRGHSDTEVLVHLYAKHGLECLRKVNGMFAFGIYDRLERTLVLARDRLGVKPLFYWRRGRTVAFASELCAMLKLPGFPTELSLEALGIYFRLGAIPEWISVYPGVCKLPPGCWVRFQLGTEAVDGPVAYWDLPRVEEQQGRSEAEWVDEIEALLWDATRIRLRSDVPLGMFLSGGIDSGLVAAAAVKQQSELSSLTISFAGESEDETALALKSARRLGLRAITRNLDLEEGLGLLPRVMAHFDEPFSDTSALPTSMVCAEARKQFTVALTGDAGDEVFGGYENHVRAWQWRIMELIPLGWRHATGTLLAGLSEADSLPRRFFRRLGQPVGRFGLGGKLYPFEDWIRTCIKPEFNLDPDQIALLYHAHLPEWAGASSIDLAQRVDLRSYMLQDILVKVDRMSMMHSLEVRSPFLDYRMVELGLRIPSHLRVKHGRNKYLLRRLAARHLPEAVCRAPKRGFGIPLRSWLNRESNAGALLRTLAMNRDGFPDPLVKGGAERVWSLSQKNPVLTPAISRLLSYRWWCQGHATH